jgi:Glycosyltransferase family 87
MVGCAPVSQPTRRASPWILLPVLVCAAGSFKSTGDDLHRYFAYANATLGRPFDNVYVHAAATNRPLVPYRDFFLEYPPGFFLAALPPALLTTNEAAYEALFETLMALCIAGALWCCVRISFELGNRIEPSEMAIWGLIGIAALGKVTFQRYDALVALCVCLMCWSAIARRPAVLGLASAAGVAAKFVPLFVAILCGIYLVRERRSREAAIAAAVATLAGFTILAPVVFSGGSAGGLIGMVRYHLDRPLEFESTAAAVLGLWHAVDPQSSRVVYSYGSGNVVGRFASAAVIASTLLLVALLAVLFVRAWRGLDRERPSAVRARALVVSTPAVLAGIIALGKVSSAQYLLWLMPLGLTISLAAPDRAMLPLLIAALTVAQIVFPISSAAAESMHAWPYGFVLLRNLLLLAWAGRTNVLPR